MFQVKVFIGGETKLVTVSNHGSQKNGKYFYSAVNQVTGGSKLNDSVDTTTVEFEHDRKDGLSVLLAKVFAGFAGGSFTKKGVSVKKPSKGKKAPAKKTSATKKSSKSKKPSKKR